MSRRLLSVALICLVFSACNRSAPVPAVPGNGATVEAAAANEASSLESAGGEYTVADPIRHANLTIFPILSNTPRLEDPFITLDEGLKAGTVEIREIGGRGYAAIHRQNVEQTVANQSDSRGARDEVEDADIGVDVDLTSSLIAGNEVNRLTVINRDSKPLYLMPGEIIVGGSQDRTIAEELVIAATGEPVPIGVYCVESGRWGARDAELLAGVLDEVAEDLSGDGAVVAAANDGKFVAKAGNLSKSSRLAAQAGEGQQKVWEEVARANGASGTTWDSNAFTANYVDREVLERLKPYLVALADVADQERIVGIVVAVNGKIETVDVFGSTPLFRKLWPQLLKSFALDALQVESTEDAKKTSTPREAEAFLASVLHDQQGDGPKTEGGLVVSRRETKEAVSFSAAAIGGMSATYFPVHASGYKK
jgi:hypothetical protein